MADNKDRTKILERARRRRQRDLERITELLTACTCEYPITTLRNGSGHRSTCPAHAIYMKHREDDYDYAISLTRL